MATVDSELAKVYYTISLYFRSAQGTPFYTQPPRLSPIGLECFNIFSSLLVVMLTAYRIAYAVSYAYVHSWAGGAAYIFKLT